VNQIPLDYLTPQQRTIIRGLFMLPISLCIVGWGWSFRHNGAIWFSRYRGPYLICYTEDGYIGLKYGGRDGPGGYPFSGGSGFDCEVTTDGGFPNFWPGYGPNRVLGFSFLKDMPSQIKATVPYWFLILIFSGVLWIVWRKTRPKPKGGAFPVVVEKGGNVQR